MTLFGSRVFVGHRVRMKSRATLLCDDRSRTNVRRDPPKKKRRQRKRSCDMGPLPVISNPRRARGYPSVGRGVEPFSFTVLSWKEPHCHLDLGLQGHQSFLSFEPSTLWYFLTAAHRSTPSSFTHSSQSCAFSFPPFLYNAIALQYPRGTGVRTPKSEDVQALHLQCCGICV